MTLPRFVEIGNVAIPGSAPLPAVGSVVEIEYLYAFAGGALFLLGLILWWLLPIHFTLPPYLFSPMLAIGYGIYCWRRAQRPRIEARE